MRRIPIWKCIYLCSYSNVDRPAFILFLPSIPFYLRACICSVHSNMLALSLSLSLSTNLHDKRCKLRRFPVLWRRKRLKTFPIVFSLLIHCFFTKYLSFCLEMHFIFTRRVVSRRMELVNRVAYVIIINICYNSHINCESRFFEDNNFFIYWSLFFQGVAQWPN